MGETSDLIAREREVWRGLSNRLHISEYAKIELELIQRFNRAKSANSFSTTVELEGFVSRVGGRLFLLRSCLSAVVGVLCDASSVRSLPTEYEFVRVKGTRILEKGTRYASNERLEVSDIDRVRLPDINLAPDIPMKDARSRILEGYPDLSREVRSNLLTSIVSSPGELTRVGGLTSTFLPIESGYADAQFQLLEDLRTSIPKDLTAKNHLTIPISGKGRFTISPFPWTLQNSSSSNWDESDSRVFSRVADGRALQETTIGFAASSAAPASLDSVWLTQADFPMIVDKEVVRYRPSARFDMDLAKFFIAVHTNYPYVDAQVDENLLRLVMPRLVSLGKEYDSLGYGGIINPDVSTGSPRSILSISKALARIDGSESVTEDHVEHALTLFSDSRHAVFETWSEMGKDFSTSHIPVRKRAEQIGRMAVKILVFLINNPNSSKAEIREAFPKVQERIFNLEFNELKKAALIYLSDNTDERYSATHPNW